MRTPGETRRSGVNGEGLVPKMRRLEHHFHQLPMCGKAAKLEALVTEAVRPLIRIAAGYDKDLPKSRPKRDKARIEIFDQLSANTNGHVRQVILLPPRKDLYERYAVWKHLVPIPPRNPVSNASTTKAALDDIIGSDFRKRITFLGGRTADMVWTNIEPFLLNLVFAYMTGDLGRLHRLKRLLARLSSSFPLGYSTRERRIYLIAA